MTKKSDLTLEILSEEIPSRMQLAAIEQFKNNFLKKLEEYGLSYGHTVSHITPRRMVLHMADVPTLQEDRVEEKRGPRVGAPEQAIQGFLASTGFSSLAECEQRSTDKGDFWFAMKAVKGVQTQDILPEIIQDVVQTFSWPKSMVWSGYTLPWVRPLRSIFCLLDGKAISGALDLGGHMISYSATISGHRFLSPNEFSPESYNHYKQGLYDNFVILDQDARRDEIRSQIHTLAEKHGLSVRQDPGLLEEVTGLVEWPVCFLGKIDAAFMDLPEEVLMTSMRVHQRYFSLEDSQGKLAPYFILTANIVPKDGGAELVQGNERVLRARLSDAKFFYEQDKSKPLSAHGEGLNQTIFQEDLDSMAQKVERMVTLSGYLADTLSLNKQDCVKAAQLAKADLMSQMVGEFPELQGIMGGYYARHAGEKEIVAKAIENQYRPKGFSDALPESLVGCVLALADKIDTLVGYFSIGIKPTGSKDPYALRRSAIGCIRLMEALGNLQLDDLVQASYQAYASVFGKLGNKVTPLEELLQALRFFFQERLKAYWKEKGVRYDYLEAVFSISQNDSFEVLAERILSLNQFLSRADGLGEKLISAYRRASNIVRLEEKKDSVSYTGAIDVNHFESKSEEHLYEKLQIAQREIEADMRAHNFEKVMADLALLGPYIDDFFEEVVVNAPEERVRHNRLRLLSLIRVTLEQVADFSKIEG